LALVLRPQDLYERLSEPAPRMSEEERIRIAAHFWYRNGRSPQAIRAVLRSITVEEANAYHQWFSRDERLRGRVGISRGQGGSAVILPEPPALVLVASEDTGTGTGATEKPCRVRRAARLARSRAMS